MAAKLALLVYRIGPISCFLLGSIIAPDQASQVEGRQSRMEVGQLKGDFLGEADAKG
jgi:hypothetical protein